MRHETTANWCFHNHGGGLKKGDAWKDTWLTWKDVRWILEQEGNETLLMKHCPTTGGSPERWQIRQGNYITLGELFVLGAHGCSCWKLYRAYTSFEIFIRKKPHPSSNSGGAIFRFDAKRAKFERGLSS